MNPVRGAYRFGEFGFDPASGELTKADGGGGITRLQPQVASLLTALLEKPGTSRYEGPVDYLGFRIPNKFVVGYGLDYAQRYRNFPDVRELDESS